MSPTAPHAEDFRSIRLDELRRAIEIYLRIAYPSGELPEAVRRRLAWGDDCTGPDQVLGRPPFEKVGRTPAGAPIVALRLGNAQYPHMKVQIQPWDHEHGFLLSVNSHDQALSLTPDSPDAPAFRAIQAGNQKVKEAIESSWDAGGLPTFNRYLRDYIASHSGGA